MAAVADLPRMEECATAFYASSRHLKGFEIGKFVEFWTGLFEAGCGVIFTLEQEGKVVGALGGLKHRDIYSADEVATEMFWYVLERARGQGNALLRAFEEWSRVEGCKEIRMALLLDSMADRLDSVYRRLGYEPMETHYSKEIKCAS